ncbi:MAG TPA: SagB family peptide dehydrogenase [Trueperaceae bacterium]|nr:SagB family peptide dehydrogenase [Trueperaceae bacterium]
MTASKGRTFGAEFFDQTKYRRGQLPPSRTRVAPPFKVLANPSEVASLPAPQLKGGTGIWTALSRERSDVAEGGRLKQTHLSQLLWGSAGFNYGRQRVHVSAQAASSLEAYLLVLNVQDLFAGVYHYNPRDHSLDQLRMGEVASEFAEVVLAPIETAAQAAVVCFTGVPGRHRVADGGRPYRYLMLDAGAAAQGLVLTASALGLAATYAADFYDDELAKLLNVDGRTEVPLCFVTIGS